MKTQYFVKAQWEEAWITEAKRLIRAEWVANYKPTDTPALLPSASTDDSPDVSTH